MGSVLNELASRGTFVDRAAVGAIAFYVASRVIRANWGDVTANRLRSVIAYTFYGFGVALLMVALARIPGCNPEGQREGKVLNEVPRTGPDPSQKHGMPDGEKGKGDAQIETQ